jgi:hypothetical protein
MWTRFATVMLLSCAGCATLEDVPAPPTTPAAQQAQEREMLARMRTGAPAPAPSPPLPAQVWSEPSRGGR